MKTHETFATSDDAKTEALNDFFVSVFTVEDESSFPEPSPATENTIDTIIFTPDMVLDKLRTLNPNKSPGNDELYP